jgi:hypothetical protein
MEDDFRFYNDYHMYREDPNVPDYNELQQSMEESQSMEGMQLAMGSRGQSAKQRQKFENQPMADYVVGEAKEAANVVGGGMADIGAAATKGAFQQFLGTPGDIIMIGRGVEAIVNRGGDETKIQAFLRGMEEKTILPTTEDVKKWLDTNVGKVGDGEHPYETIGEFFGPGGQVKVAKAVTKGVIKGTKSLAPAAGEMFETYAARTGLTNYIVQPKRSLGTLVKKLESGAMDEQSYIEGTKLLNDALQKKPEKISPEDRVRGKDHVTSRLLAALSPTANIQLKESTVRFAEWLLYNNPHLANDLGISIKESSQSKAGKYTTNTGDRLLDRVATIFANNAGDDTAVHEILHHTEQMMPFEIQNGVTDAWTKAYLKGYREATPEVKEYLKLVPLAINGQPGARNKLMEGFFNGTLSVKSHYQLVNPSEYWAENATRILNSRYEANSWIAKAKVWLNEFTEKSKDAFGLPSDAEVLRGLKAVIGGKGEFTSPLLTNKVNVAYSASRVKKEKQLKKQMVSDVKKLAVGTAASAALTGDEGQK